MSEVDPYIPEYNVEEKEDVIIIIILAPLSKPKEAVLLLEKNVFTFDSPPYLLKIKLPHSVCDRFSQKAYNGNTKTYKIKLRKCFQSVNENSDEDVPTDSAVSLEAGEVSFKDNKEKIQFYGFANKYSKIFGKLFDEFSEIISAPNPDYIDINERRALRIKEENEKWSDDHYLADTMETDHLDSIFKYEPPWIVRPLIDDFSNDEKEILAEILDKSKVDNLSSENIRLSEFQIIDILFGYAYNKRTTEGDNTVESGWTISKLSSTLCWFELFADLKTVILTCYRRSLIFPLYRNWKLTQMVHDDLVNILKAGCRQVTRCLLEVKEIFNESDNYYILNSLYVNDLCNFAYHVTDERWSELKKEVEKINIKKYEVNTDLPLLEVAAHLALEEAKEDSEKRTSSRVSNIVDKIAGLNLDTESDSSCEDSDSAQSSNKED